MPFHLLGVSGSLREGSHGGRALEIALEHAKARGAEVRLLDLRLVNLPMYNPDEHHDGEVLATVTRDVNWADAFILASPDYHGSMSGAMKNFLDYHWHELTGKLFGYLCASHEKGLTVMDQMRTAVRQCYGWSMPYGVSVHGEHDFSPGTGAASPLLDRRLRMLARDAVVYGKLICEQYRADLSTHDPDTFAARHRK